MNTVMYNLQPMGSIFLSLPLDSVQVSNSSQNNNKNLCYFLRNVKSDLKILVKKIICINEYYSALDLAKGTISTRGFAVKLSW